MADEFQYDVFLSHSAKDKAVVRPLAERLRADGLKVWFDEWEIKPGDSIPAKIEDGLEQSRVLVLCMSANAFGSDWAQLEAGTFRFRDPLNQERRFLPLRLDDDPIKVSLAQFLYINWRPADREENYLKLLQACQRVAKPSSLESATAHVQDWLKTLKRIPLLGQYVVAPVMAAFQEAFRYTRNLTFSVLLVKRLHRLLGNMSDEQAVKQSREFLLTSIGLSAAIVAFIAFVPEEPAESRKEIVQAWLSGMLASARVAVLFCIQGTVTWFFVRRRLRTNLSPMRFFALVAFFIGGPCFFLVTAAHSLEFGLPSGLLLRIFFSRLVVEGLLGWSVTLLGFVLLCAYLRPLARRPQWRSVLIAALLWHVVWLGLFAAEVAVMRRPLVRDAMEKLTEHRYLVTTELAQRVAHDEAADYAKHIRQTGKVPPEAIPASSAAVFDSWRNPIVSERFSYTDETGLPHPYWLAISAGPNRKLDITGADVARLREALAVGRFASVEQVDRAVDLALAPYERVPSQVVTNRDGTLSRRYAEESWEKVDIFGTTGIPHSQWPAILQRLTGRWTNAISR